MVRIGPCRGVNSSYSSRFVKPYVCIILLFIKSHSLVMAEVTWGTAKAVAFVTFVVGFVLGYKAKEWRIKWMRMRRDRLASSLAETQKKLEGITIS